MSNVELTQASVDYITATTASPTVTAQVQAWYAEVAQARVDLGQKESSWSGYGYQGFRVGPYQYGEGAHGAICRVSGVAANNAWAHLTATMDRVTRLDLAVTVQYKRPLQDVARNIWERTLTLAETGKLRQKHKFIVSDGGGQTVYLGRRGSRYLGRVYDKGVESNAASEGYQWRWEVQINRPVADGAAGALLESFDVARDVQGYVWAWWYSRGLSPSWLSTEGTIIIERDIKVVGPDSTLSWLSTCVRPVIERLSAQGYANEVYEALSLPLIDNSPQSSIIKEAG